MLFVSQEERRASDTVLFTSENNDIANQSVDTSFFTSEKNRMTNQLASLARKDYFYLNAFLRVNLGMYIIMLVTTRIPSKPLALYIHLSKELLILLETNFPSGEGGIYPSHLLVRPTVKVLNNGFFWV